MCWQSKTQMSFSRIHRDKKKNAGRSDSSDQVPTQVTLRSLGRVVTVTAIISLDARRLIFHNIILGCQASNFWKLTCVFRCCFFCVCICGRLHPRDASTFFFRTISFPLLKHSHLSYLVSGAVRQYGPGRLFVLGSQWLPSALYQLSEHQRRPVGDVAQHPSGPAGEQHGPQRGTVPMSAPCRNISSSQWCLACIITTETLLANIFSLLLKASVVPEGWRGCHLHRRGIRSVLVATSQSVLKVRNKKRKMVILLNRFVVRCWKKHRSVEKCNKMVSFNV